IVHLAAYCLFLTLRPPTRSTLFPYTTLFRSSSCCTATPRAAPHGTPGCRSSRASTASCARTCAASAVPLRCRAISRGRSTSSERSEEHTSELQSLAYLVCRLLLEKKNRRATI